MKTKLESKRNQLADEQAEAGQRANAVAKKRALLASSAPAGTAGLGAEAEPSAKRRKLEMQIRDMNAEQLCAFLEQLPDASKQRPMEVDSVQVAANAAGAGAAASSSAAASSFSPSSTARGYTSIEAVALWLRGEGVQGKEFLQWAAGDRSCNLVRMERLNLYLARAGEVRDLLLELVHPAPPEPSMSPDAAKTPEERRAAYTRAVLKQWRSKTFSGVHGPDARKLACAAKDGCSAFLMACPVDGPELPMDTGRIAGVFPRVEQFRDRPGGIGSAASGATSGLWLVRHGMKSVPESLWPKGLPRESSGLDGQPWVKWMEVGDRIPPERQQSAKLLSRVIARIFFEFLPDGLDGRWILEDLASNPEFRTSVGGIFVKDNPARGGRREVVLESKSVIVCGAADPEKDSAPLDEQQKARKKKFGFFRNYARYFFHIL